MALKGWFRANLPLSEFGNILYWKFGRIHRQGIGPSIDALHAGRPHGTAAFSHIPQRTGSHSLYVRVAADGTYFRSCEPYVQKLELTL
jgi:hypothetical protein